MGLDTDIQAADSQLLVKFYEREYGPEKGRDFIRIDIPGNQTLQIDTFAKEQYRRRFPHHWLRYQMEKDGNPIMSGITLDDWMKDRPDDLNPDQLAELQHFKFQTVEQLAMASDQAIQRIGMGGEGLRAKAQFYVKAKNKSSLSSELKTHQDEIDRLRQEAIERDAAFKAMQMQISELMTNRSGNIPAPKPRGMPKGGWPKKVEADGKHAPATGDASHQ
jgi:hypothetical protein